MKEEKEKASKPGQPNAAADATNADMEWFNQFENLPGIHDDYTLEELNTLKTQMLADLKKKINKLD